MALESKPLFHPEVLRQQVRSFNLPDQTAAWQPKLQEWARLVASGRADDFKETALLPDFLTDIFCGLFGYPRPHLRAVHHRPRTAAPQPHSNISCPCSRRRQSAQT